MILIKKNNCRFKSNFTNYKIFKVNQNIKELNNFYVFKLMIQSKMKIY